MEKLLVRNFGPLKDGLKENDGYITISPVTVICGAQATGKSTIAKLYSSFSWLEKAMAKADLNPSSFSTSDFLKICENHRLTGYFKDNTLIRYVGTKYTFSYENGTLKLCENNSGEEYRKPKIMYVPSERNLITAIENAERINGLPVMLSVFLDEYNNARKAINGDTFRLPVSGIGIRYDKNTLQTVVVTDSSCIPITAASSGIQSVAPLSIVTEYLSSSITAGLTEKIQKLSSAEREMIMSYIPSAMKEELNTYFYSGLSKNNREIEEILKSYFPSRFINIVEEPEQNLYPESQKNVLYELLACLNGNSQNKLLLTTHSPYILSYLILSAKAGELYKKGLSPSLIAKYVPENSSVWGEDIAIYETKDDGTVEILKPQYGLPSDDNELNNAMMKTNEIFSELLHLEAEFVKN